VGDDGVAARRAHPLLILVLGFGNSMQLTIIVLSAVFPIMVNCMEGVKTVDPSLVRAGRVFVPARRSCTSR